jgi:hypothetical protein
MSLDEINTVDAIGIESDTDHAILTIADSWDWTREYDHLLALQAKLNAYFEFIENGQVWESYPLAKGKRLRINVVFRFPPPVAATILLARASEIASKLDVLVCHDTFRGAVSWSTDF